MHDVYMTQAAVNRIPALTLGWRLKMALAQSGLSAGGMAENLGVNPATVSRWMGDKGKRPKDAFVKQWALAAGVEYQWLDSGITPPQDDPSDGEECAIRDSNPEPADYAHAQVTVLTHKLHQITRTGRENWQAVPDAA